MVKPVPKQIPAMPFPFAPTPSPGHEHVMMAAGTILTLAQLLFKGNPKPIITALKAAEHAYCVGAKESPESGLTEKDIEDHEVLGIQIAGIILAQAKKAEEKLKSGIVQPNSELVGPDGRPLGVKSSLAALLRNQPTSEAAQPEANEAEVEPPAAEIPSDDP